LIDNYKPSDDIIYNDKVLKDVFDNIGIRAYKGLKNFDDFDSALIVIKDPNDEEREFIEKNESKLEEVVTFDSYLRLGDDIEVYSYIGTENPINDCGCDK
jgi:hypothetical protein